MSKVIKMKTETFSSINEFNTELNRILKKNTLKDEKITESDLRSFINNNRHLISGQNDDRALQINLGKLANRIKKQFIADDGKTTKTGMALADKILFLAGFLFKTTIKDMPPELLEKILLDATPLPQRGLGGHYARIHQPGNLKTVTRPISKQFRKAGLELKKKWISKEGVSLKNLGCKTAIEAIDYVIKHELKGANLEDFRDLDDSHIERLINSRPNLELLFISSNKITQASADKISTLVGLKDLIVANSAITDLNLENNTALFQVSCNRNPLLTKFILPKVANSLRGLHCTDNPNLAQFNFPDEAKSLRGLYFNSNGKVTQLTLPNEANALVAVECHDNASLIQFTLPREMQNLFQLGCKENRSLVSLTLPDKANSLTQISIYSTALAKVALPSEARALVNVFLSENRALTQLTLPNEVSKALRWVSIVSSPQLTNENISNFEQFQSKVRRS